MHQKTVTIENHQTRKEHIQSPESTQPLIEIRNLGLQYGKKWAFRDVSFDIPEQRVTAIIGPSGCGKSSLISCLNRLCDITPKTKVSGTVKLDSLNIFLPDTNVQALRRQVGMVFQKPNPFPFSIRKNFEFPLVERGVSRKGQIQSIMEETLRSVGLWDEVQDRLDESALALSGGQQQRLCIARTLALKPRVILMDEPCSALDPISSGIVEKCIKNLRQDITIVIVTHNLAQARRLADQIAFFWVEFGAGTLIEFGDSQQIFEDSQCSLTKKYVNGLEG